MIPQRLGALMDSSILPSFHKASSSKYLGRGNSTQVCLTICAVNAESCRVSSPIFEADHAWGAGASTLMRLTVNKLSRYDQLRLIDTGRGESCRKLSVE